MNRVRVGIIGSGTIGQVIIKACMTRLNERVKLISIFDCDNEKILKAEKLAGKKLGAISAKQVFDKCSLIIEAAGANVSPVVLKQAIKSRKDVMIMSVGGLVGHEKLLGEAEKKGIKVYLPSGAISGIDALKAAKGARIDSVTLTTKKSPKGLTGAPYFKTHNINLGTLKKEKVVFSGSAREAVKGFPQNINVAAVLSLAGIGVDRTRVNIVAVPGLTRNIHEIMIQGSFGTIKTVTENVPSPDNPKTSYLAALSEIATIKNIAENIHVGT